MPHTPHRTSLSVHAERAFLIGCVLPGEEEDEDSLEELTRLAITAGAQPVGTMIQHRHAPDPATYIGRGKVDQLKDTIKEKDVEVVIVDHDLTPSQVRNLETMLEVKVIDRSELILDIFATHARTKQAKLQVELAQLEYTLPRLRRMWTHLSRIVGGMKSTGGIGTRGPGEKQIEVDRRLAHKRIYDLKKRLREIQQRKEREVKARRDEFLVSLVGYTNAGKSTLMNALTGAGVLVEDKLFATLDTRTRRLELESGISVLLSDTVGFIRRLPHHLVASFHATLEEARQADLLLHIVDASAEQALRQIQAVEDVLKELGCRETPTLLVLNKIDLVRDTSSYAMLRAMFPEAISISALTGEGIETLRMEIAQRAEARRITVRVRSSQTLGKVLATLSEVGEILQSEYDEDGGALVARVEPRHLGLLSSLGKDVELEEIRAG